MRDALVGACEVDVVDDEHELLALHGVRDRARDERDRQLARILLDPERRQTRREARGRRAEVLARDRDDAVIAQVRIRPARTSEVLPTPGSP